MRVKSEILRNMHLDRSYCLLPVKNVKILLEIFRVLDIRENGALDGELAARRLFVPVNLSKHVTGTYIWSYVINIMLLTLIVLNSTSHQFRVLLVCLIQALLTVFFLFFVTKSLCLKSKLDKHLRSSKSCMSEHTFCLNLTMLILLMRSKCKTLPNKEPIFYHFVRSFVEYSRPVS